MTRKYFQSREDRAKLDGMYECILCACCMTSCPSLLVESRVLPGPSSSDAGLPVDCRLAGSVHGRAFWHGVNDTMKLYRCHGIMNCTNCCPKGLDPAKAIVHLKEQVAETYKDGWKSMMTEQIVKNKGRESGMMYM